MEILEIKGDDKVPALKCDSSTKESCNEKEVAYIAKVADWDEAKIKAQVERIEGMMDSKTKADLKEWMMRRMHILKQLIPVDGATEL